MSERVSIIDVNGKKIVEINTIEFSSKRRIDWKGVERYLKQYVGNRYFIEQTGEAVCIGKDFPDEYTHSRYSTKSLGTIGKAKANATQAIPELIRTAQILYIVPIWTINTNQMLLMDGIVQQFISRYLLRMIKEV